MDPNTALLSLIAELQTERLALRARAEAAEAALKAALAERQRTPDPEATP